MHLSDLGYAEHACRWCSLLMDHQHTLPAVWTVLRKARDTTARSVYLDKSLVVSDKAGFAGCSNAPHVAVVCDYRKEKQSSIQKHSKGSLPCCAVC